MNVLPENETDCRAACMSRRAVVAAAAGGAAVVLAGCSTYGNQDAASVQPATEGATNEPAGEANDAGAEGTDGGAKVQNLANVKDVPVGGGLILEDEGVVLTQWKKGKIKAFSATCTHQGCAVTDVADGNINCACHGSAFDIKDGTVTSGPAKKALKTVKVRVRKGKISKV